MTLSRRYTPPAPDPGRDEKMRENIEKLRSDSEAKRKIMREKKLPLLINMGLKDPKAAADCLCSCHPSPGDVSLHENGLSCSCQLSAKERKEKMTELLASLQESHIEHSGYYKKLQDRALEKAESLGIELNQIGGAAPFTIDLTVDGRKVYVRSRHELYSIRISTREAPLEEISYDAEHIIVEEGDEQTLFGYTYGPDTESSPDQDLYARILAYVVNSVRIFLLREKCNHDAAEPANFCATCGLQLKFFA